MDVEHSKMFSDIMEYYRHGFWSLNQVKNAVAKGKITEDEFQEITGQTY